MKRMLMFAILTALLLLSSCTKDTKETQSDYAAFLGLLTENEFQYTEEKPDTDSFLSVERKPIFIGDEIISVYEYKSTQEMEKDSTYINPDGYGISRPGSEVRIDWVSLPHFFKKDTLIINYVGEDELILKLLTNNYGAEFAGNGYAAE